jgi:hypothetical protein
MGGLRFVSLVLAITVVTSFIVGAISWLVGWRTFAQYANLVIGAGVVILLIDLFLYDDGRKAPVIIRPSASKWESREVYDKSKKMHEQAIVNTTMKHGVGGQDFSILSAIVGLLMISSGVLIYIYLVN